MTYCYYDSHPADVLWHCALTIIYALLITVLSRQMTAMCKYQKQYLQYLIFTINFTPVASFGEAMDTPFFSESGFLG